MLLTAIDGATFRFDPGASCLELAHTGGPGPRAVYESLHTPADLAAWLGGHLRGEAAAGPGLRTDDGAPAPAGRGHVEAPAGMTGRITAGDLADVVALRDAIWAAVDAWTGDQPLPADAVDEINRRAAGPPVTSHIGPDGRRVRTEPVTVGQVLTTLAQDAVDLVTDVDPGRLRQCAADDCFLVFVDTSRAGRRHWCSMERCGNRAKVRSFRARHRQETT